MKTVEAKRLPAGKVACSCGRVVDVLWRVASSEDPMCSECLRLHRQASRKEVEQC